LPSVKASHTVRKNHPPAIDIIEFHTSPMVAAGSSTMRKYPQRPRRKSTAASRSSAGMPRSEA
jgi:hypothetical protein